MGLISDKRVKTWIILSINLSFAFLIGLNYTFGAFFLPLLILLIFIILHFYMKDINSSFTPKEILALYQKEIIIWALLTINLLFSFLIGATIPLMEAEMYVRYNMGLILIPLLVLLNYILVDRFYFYLKGTGESISFQKQDENPLKNEKIPKKKKRTVIEFEGKRYIFTIRSIIILAIGAPILSYMIYLFFDMEQNYWLHEIVVKQTVYLLNLFFNMDAKALYDPTAGKYHWSFSVPNRGSIYFETFCTGIQAICVFAGIIILIPHSLDQNTKSDIIWRKTKALILSSAIFYIVNIIRMIIQIYLFYLGYAWEDIHYSISAAISFIAAIIILLLHKWIPEFIISIIYTGKVIGEKLKPKHEIVNQSNKALEL